MRIKLTRFAHLSEGTLGKIQFSNGLALYSIERPWLDNQPFVSCIPSGIYELEYDMTGRIKEVPRLRDTFPRTQINIHIANFARELQGCIAPGMDWSIENKIPRVIESRKAMNLLNEFLYKDFDLLDLEDGSSLNCAIDIVDAKT